METPHGESNTAFASTHANISHLENKDTGKQRHKSNSNPDSKEGNSTPVSKKEPAIQIDEKYESDSGSSQINSQGAGASIHPPDDILASTESPAPTSAMPITPPVPLLQPKKMQGSDPADLAALWKVIIVEKYGDYVPPFAKKDFGQLKDFIQACPPGQAASILECCLRDWSGFTVYAKEDYATFGLPNRPTLDFLLKYRVGAVNFALNEAKEAAKHQAMLDKNAKKMTVVPPLKPTVEKPGPDYVPATLEEVLAILNEDTTTDDDCKATKIIATKNDLNASHKTNVVEKPNGKALTDDQMMEIKEDEHYGSLKLPK